MMNEVDKTRNFIDALRENIGSCKDNEASWEDRAAALIWLTQNIGEAVDDDVKWEQRLSEGSKPYLTVFSTKSVNEKGEENAYDYLFDLSDINPLGIKLEASGKTLAVAVPVREDNKFIEVKKGDGKEFTDELMIYSNDIEAARQMVNALSFVVSNTEAVRTAWAGYNEALDFVKEHLGEVRVGDDLIKYSLQFDLFASNILDLSVSSTDSDGATKEVTNSFYPADMNDKLNMKVSRREVTIEMETRNDLDFVRKTSGGNVTGYTSNVELQAPGIDEARDLMNALEYVIQNSEEEIETFTNVDEVNSWMEGNLVLLLRDGEKYEQKLLVNKDLDNQISFEKQLTKDDSEITATRYLIYPEDMNLEEMKIQVRYGKLTVILGTGKNDYIKYYKNGELQNFTDGAEVYFFDPLVAKNFISAIRFLKDDISKRNQPEMSREEALSLLTEKIQTIELTEETHVQKLEMVDPDQCILKFTRVETGKDGKSDEFIYEFMASDLAEEGSGLSVKGKLVEVMLETTGEKDLIKPYKNGEVQDFVDGFVIYADDVSLAKRILGAFSALSSTCK
jgi:hypothetical protein